MIKANCEVLLQNSLSLLEQLELLIVVNQAIVYLLINFFVKKNSQNYCNFYVPQLNIQIFQATKKNNRFFVKLVDYLKHHDVR